MGEIEKQLVDFFNSSYFNRKNDIKSVQSYLSELKEILSVCQEKYDSILFDNHSKTYDFPSYFFDIEWFGKRIKEILKNNDQFNIIVDYHDSITLEANQAIMMIIGTKCAKTICMKVATDPKHWSTYTDQMNCFKEKSYQKVLGK